MSNGNEQKSFENRMATLEEKARAQADVNAHVTETLGEIRRSQTRIETALAVLQELACPSPGACEELAKDARAQQEQLNDIQQFIATQKGGWKVLLYICAAASTCGSALGWLVSTISQHSHRLPPTP